VGPPYADGAGHVSIGDPLAVGGVARHRDWVGVLAVHPHLQWVVEVAYNDRSASAVENVVRFGVAGDENVAIVELGFAL